MQAIINAVTPGPVLTSTSNCGPGTVTLTATSASQVRWYSAISGGSVLATGLTFTTPVISGTTTYYAEAGPVGCQSSRVSVQAVINSIPAAPAGTGNSRCGTGSVSLSASGGSQLLWYTSASGGSSIGSGTSFSTPNISSTTNYFVESNNGSCHSSRVPVQAVIIPLPAPPVANDATRCGPGQFTLTASSPQQIYWYDSPAGGTLLTTGTIFTTPSLTVSTDYYVETGNTCRSNRVEVHADIVAPPDAPVLFDTSRCGDGVLVIRAVSSTQVNWYNVPSGGSVIATGLNFTTPFINATTTYYADAGLGCNSTRVPVQANIDFPPAVPVTADSTRCGAGSVTLHATSTELLSWYDAPSGGTLLATGSDFTTPAISNTTIFYVEAGEDCRSARIAVHAITGGTQVSSANNGSHCGPSSIILSAVASVPQDSILWYDSPGGNNAGSGGFFITPFLTSTTTYYVVARSGCTGLPIAVTASIFISPVVDLGPDTIVIESGQTATLDAGSGYSSYEWSTNATSSEIVVGTTGLYTVAVNDSNGCTGTDHVFVNVVTSVNSIAGIDLLKVFPNPAHEELTILLPSKSSRSLSMKLYSADGKILFREELKPVNGEFTKTLSLSGIAAGIYFLEIENDTNSGVVKVIIQ